MVRSILKVHAGLAVAIGWIAMVGAISTGRAASDEPVADELRRHVTKLAGEIGERGTYKPAAYVKARDYLVGQFREMGYEPKLQTSMARGVECANVEVTVKGGAKGQEIVVVGGHYDSVEGSPGANDNGSGTAGMLVLARMLKDAKPDRTLRFVAFAEEEPPSFQTKTMGSLVYAKACKARGEKIVGMFSLETIGFYTEEPNSQKYPAPYDKVYPPVGNFIAFVANVESGELMRRSLATFKEVSKVPAEGGAVPDMAPGIGWSDHWSFWQVGYPALMVTDTAPFRYPHYHKGADAPDQLDYAKMGQVIEGLDGVIRELAGAAGR